MCFVCGFCKEQTSPGQKAKRVVVETEPITYPYRVDAHGKGKDDPGGHGTRIVKEVLVGPCCA